MIFEASQQDGNPFVLVDYTNDSDAPRDIYYASLTAPRVVRCEIYIDDVLIELVYAGNGGSHSWWSAAGGKFFPPDKALHGLQPGATLKVIVDGPCAMRIDWV
jgi:hypothetical protein